MSRAGRRTIGALCVLGLCGACRSSHDFIDPALFYADAAASPSPGTGGSAAEVTDAASSATPEASADGAPPGTPGADGGCGDDDGDGLCNGIDRCPQVAHQDDSADLDEDGIPDACDVCGPAVVLAKQPLFLLRFDEPTGSGQVQNLGSANPSGSYEGPVALGALGVAGAGSRALHVPGQGNVQYPRVAFTNVDKFPANALTVSFWLRTSQTSEFAVVSYAVGADSNHFLMSFISQGPVRVVVRNQVVDTPGNITPQLADGSWHHIVLTGTATSELQLYVDAEPVATLTMPPAQDLASGGALILGQEQDALNGGFDAAQALDGDLDELAIFERAFTAGEVREVFAAMSCCDSCG